MKDFIKQNLAETYVGSLLFVAIPVGIGFYLGWRAALLSSFVAQAVIGVMYVRNK